MSERHEIDYLLTISIEETEQNLRRLERALYRLLGVIGRLGLPEDIKQAMATVQRMIFLARSLQTAYHMLQVARMAAGDPIAWITAGAAGGAAMMNFVDISLEVSANS